MGLNIKNERVHELARRAAEVTGKSQTGAIEEALMRLLQAYDIDPEQQSRAAKIDRVHDIVDAFVTHAPHGRSPAGAPSMIEDLYDEATGLPR